MWSWLSDITSRSRPGFPETQPLSARSRWERLRKTAPRSILVDAGEEPRCGAQGRVRGSCMVVSAPVGFGPHRALWERTGGSCGHSSGCAARLGSWQVSTRRVLWRLPPCVVCTELSRFGTLLLKNVIVISRPPYAAEDAGVSTVTDSLPCPHGPVILRNTGFLHLQRKKVRTHLSANMCAHHPEHEVQL